eukprot:6447422-Heterocapsa_arctica.AAC.1
MPSALSALRTSDRKLSRNSRRPSSLLQADSPERRGFAPSRGWSRRREYLSSPSPPTCSRSSRASFRNE